MKDLTAADNLGTLLMPSIQKALVGTLRIEIVEDIQNGLHFKGKKYFIAQILEDLANEHDFDLYKSYLSNPATSFSYWAKVYLEQHCQAKNNGETKLMTLAKICLQTIIKEITKVAYDLKDQYATTSGDGSDINEHCIDINSWLESFLGKINKIATTNWIPGSTTNDRNKKCKKSYFFTEVLIKNLNKTKDTILQEFEDQSSEMANVTEWNNPPHLILCNTLIDCTEQCPFCKEQCELTDPDHILN